MSTLETDVLIVGSGLGSTAAAKALADHGLRVTLVPGIGRSRSRHIDGGVVAPSAVEAAFGSGAPLGDPVSGEASIQASAANRWTIGPVRGIGLRRRFRRSELEDWAMDRALASGAVYLDDFIEGKALPVDDGRMALTSERDDRVIRARVIALGEGADPRIPLRVHLRPDYGPEDQLHFARTLLSGSPVENIVRGAWRASWGMPVEVMLTPQLDGTLVSVVTRIENVMRAYRSSKDALQELLDSSEFASLGVDGLPGEMGMELVAVRRERRDMAFVHDRLLMGIDFSGVIDPRRLDRAELTIAAGRHLAAYLIGENLQLDGWPDSARRHIRDAMPSPGAYHDDEATGYLEERPASVQGKLTSAVKSLVRRGRRVGTGAG